MSLQRESTSHNEKTTKQAVCGTVEETLIKAELVIPHQIIARRSFLGGGV